MRTLAALLLVLIAAVHYGPDLLAQSYPEPEAARRALYYVARSIEGAIQYALIAGLACKLQPGTLSSWWTRATEPGRWKGPAATFSAPLVVLACCCGSLEHAQSAACRLSVGIANRPPPVAMMTGICDDLLGLPMYALGLGAVAFIAAVVAANQGERLGNG